MSEFNVFCWSEQYDDDKSLQQKRYRIFNKEYTADTYHNIVNQIRTILKNPSNMKLSDFWKSITQNQIKELMSIKDLEFDIEGFEYITGIKVEKELTDVDKAIQLLESKGLIKDGKIFIH